jgi:hypothetical protein
MRYLRSSFRVTRGLGGRDDHCACQLSGLLVRTADQGDIRHGGMCEQFGFDVVDRDHGHPTDPVAGATHQPDPAALVRNGQVAGVLIGATTASSRAAVSNNTSACHQFGS